MTKLQKKLNELKMSQKEFADLIGYHWTNVNLWCLGKTQPRLEAAKTVATALNCKIEDIF